MSEGNGNSKWLMWLAGILATILTTAFFTLAQAVVSNDKESRNRDEKIDACMQQAVIEQKSVNQDILIALKEISVDLNYIKKNVK